MNNEQRWLEWIRELPKSIKATITFITAIVAFLGLWISKMYLVTIVVGGFLIVGTLGLCLFVRFAKTPPLIQEGEGVHRFDEKWRQMALIGIVFIPLVFVFLLTSECTRSFVAIAIQGTPTPISTPTCTHTPTPTITPTPTVTPCPTPTPLAEIATLNVQETSDGRTTNLIAELSIEPLEYGDIHLEVPNEILVGESDVIRLEIIPDSALENLPQTSISPSLRENGAINKNLGGTETLEDLPNYLLEVDDRIQVYPVMSAELSGANFNTSPQGVQTIAIVSSSPVEWLWSITPRESGYQSLALTISVPVAVRQNDEQIALHPLKNVPLEVFVAKKELLFAYDPSPILFILVIIIAVLCVLIYIVDRQLHPM